MPQGSYDKASHDPRRPVQPGGVEWPPEPGGFQNQARQAEYQQPGYGQGQPGAHGSEPSFDGRQDYGHQHEAGEHAHDPDDDYEYEDEPRGGRRWLIVAALVGSICVGGVMAYGYKALMGPAAQTRTAQVVKAPRDPVRVTPSDPGGRRFASTEDKFTKRLPSSGGGEVASAATVDSSGVRRVPTVRVGADLAIEAPAAGPPPTGADAAGGAPGVPGMTIVGGGTTPSLGSGPPPAGPVALQSPLGARQAPQQQPGRIQSQGGFAEPRSPPPQNAAPRRPPPQRIEASAGPAAAPTRQASAATGAKTPRSATAGFVTVLGYQKGRMEALRMMADLQQKYTLLQGQKLDVVESDQTSRGLGIIYRIVAGPPSARSTANDLCNQLKGAGFKGCWAMAR